MGPSPVISMSDLRLSYARGPVSPVTCCRYASLRRIYATNMSSTYVRRTHPNGDLLCCPCCSWAQWRPFLHYGRKLFVPTHARIIKRNPTWHPRQKRPSTMVSRRMSCFMTISILGLRVASSRSLIQVLTGFPAGSPE